MAVVMPLHLLKLLLLGDAPAKMRHVVSRVLCMHSLPENETWYTEYK